MSKRVLLVGLFFLLSASAALGDGCYIPERAVRKIPEIPAQRAIVSWKDGVETLVIASALDSESQSLGWIIPVPAVPDTIEKETPGALRTLNFCLQPQIIHHQYTQLASAMIFTVVGILFFGTFLFARNNFLAVLITIIIIALFLSLMLPAGSPLSISANKAANVQVEKSVTVGSYDVRVLRAEKAEDLNAWLDENGFASLPQAAERTIADYASNGWVFAAIKLTRAEKGANTPHPIRMSFASQRAVYPLILTAIAGGSPAFEIFVIADKSASCGLLAEEFCDRFSVPSQYTPEEDYEKGSRLFVGEHTECRIGHPALCRLMWDGCVVTKFSGSIAAADMKNDVHFDWKPFAAFQRKYYTIQGARDTILTRFIFVSGAWGMISMWLFRNRIRQPRGGRWFFARALLPVIALFALCGEVWFASAPKLDPSDVQLSRMSRSHPWRLHGFIKNSMEHTPELLQKPEPEIIELILNTAAQREMRNPAGGEIKVEDSPGNFTIEKLFDKIVFRVYDMAGGVLIFEHPLPDSEDKSDEK